MNWKMFRTTPEKKYFAYPYHRMKKTQHCVVYYWIIVQCF